MLERAGLLQRPCRHPHPGALPPKYQFVDYYAPVNPKERKAHFSALSLDREPETTVRIIAGDLNDCPNVMVDRKSVSTEGWPHKQAGKIKSWSRIDYILLSEQHAYLLVSGTTYLDALLSDHRPVCVGIACPTAESTSALPSLPETSSQLLRVNTRSYPLDPLAAFEEAMSRLRSASSDHARHLNQQFSTTKETLERRIQDLEALDTFDDGRRAEWQDLVAMTKLRGAALSHGPCKTRCSPNGIKIDTLRLADGSPSTDLTKCLDHARAYF
ncbi:BQ5605_C040g11911 [Microbotryum silenes-dioicae]|uniref:BQ5605_C040g11911 protein n=1 Tax=Microbotryum silenes-dioicae TaxID=796604 RepID=A0A2X0NIK0_9BASI|nr:BQ5605_C040g11911 [Microbotryum silenes-dioicae]